MKKTYTIRFNQGDLVISGKLVVLVTNRYGSTNEGYPCFAGTVIIEDLTTNPGFNVGMFSRTWDLAAFKRLNCKINLLAMADEIKTYEPKTF